MGFIKFVFILFLIFLLIKSTYLRCFLCHPVSVLKYAAIDTYRAFRNRKNQTFDEYGIDMFIGMFGKGKTLTMTHRVRELYFKFGDKIRIVSNYELKGIPYTPLINFNQLLEFGGVSDTDVEEAVSGAEDDPDDVYDLPELVPDQDDDEIFFNPDVFDDSDDYIGTIVCIDEVSSILSNRKYADFPLELLGLLCQPRKKRVYIMCTAQRFFMVDKLFRSLTTNVYDCNKIWRLAGYRVFDAWEYEQATTSTLLSPIGAGCWFVEDDDYACYSTEELVTKNKASDFISNDEAAVRKGMDAAKVVNTSGVKLSRKAKRKLGLK